MSLRSLGLFAPDGLDCPDGGTHAILEPELQIAVKEAHDVGRADVKCQRCGALVDLRPMHAL